MSEQNNDAQLTDAERAHVMGLAMRGAVFWGGIVEVISIVFLTVSAISQSSLPVGNEWYVLLNGPIVLVAYFIIKRASLLDRSATTRRDKQRKIINEEVVRPGLNEFYDEIKGTAGGVATWVFIVTSIVLFVLDGGIGALFSLRALAFIVIGMFVAAVVIGGLTYGLSRLISRRLARSMGNDQLFDPQYARRVTRIGWVMQIANIIIGVAFTLSLYGILFWS